MKRSSILTQLALAGIASGLISITAFGDEMNNAGGPAVKKDTGMVHAKPTKKRKKAKKKSAMNDSTSMSQGMKDTTMAKTAHHGCKGQNACKGLGGGPVSESELKDLAAKAGIPLEKAGKAHSCKGLNSCKGLGGCAT